LFFYAIFFFFFPTSLVPVVPIAKVIPVVGLKAVPGTLVAKVAPSEVGARFWFPNHGWVAAVGWKGNCWFVPKCDAAPKPPNVGGKVVCGGCSGCGCGVKPVKVPDVPKVGSCGVVPGLLKGKAGRVVKDIELSAICCVAGIDPNKCCVGATVGVEATNEVGWAVAIPINLNILLLLFWLLTVVVPGEVFVSMDTGSPLVALDIKLKLEGFEICAKLNPLGALIDWSVMVGLLDCNDALKTPEITGNSTFVSLISCFFCGGGNEVEAEAGVVIENPSVDGCPKGNLFSDEKLNKDLLASVDFHFFNFLWFCKR